MGRAHGERRRHLGGLLPPPDEVLQRTPFHLFAELGQLGQAAFVDGAQKIIDRADAQQEVEVSQATRPQRGDAPQQFKVLRKQSSDALKRLDAPGAQELLHLGLDALPHPFDAAQLPAFADRAEVLRQLLNAPGRLQIAVGPPPLPLELHGQGQIVEQIGRPPVVRPTYRHRHRTALNVGSACI